MDNMGTRGDGMTVFESHPPRLLCQACVDDFALYRTESAGENTAYSLALATQRLVNRGREFARAAASAREMLFSTT